MTLGAFYYITNGLAAIAAMFVIWLSTLGLYVVMVMVRTGLNLAELLPGLSGASATGSGRLRRRIHAGPASGACRFGPSDALAMRLRRRKNRGKRWAAGPERPRGSVSGSVAVAVQ